MADVLNLTVTSSIVTAGTTQNGPPFSLVDSNISQRLIDRIAIGASQTDFSISLDAQTAVYLILKFDQSVSIKLNSTGNTAIALTASPSHPAAIMLVGGAITSVFVTTTTAVGCERLIAS
jgi:hypothetical protein